MSAKIVAVVPAFSSAGEIPRMNVRELGSRPLFTHAITTSKDAKSVDETVLVTDSEQIRRIGQGYDIKTLTVDSTPDSSDINRFELARATEQLDDSVEYVLCVHPTVPLVTPAVLDEGLERVRDQSADSIVFATAGENRCWTVSGERPTAEKWNESCYEEIGLFATRPECLDDWRGRNRTTVIQEVDGAQGNSIQTYGDWVRAENHLSRKKLVYRVKGSQESGSGHVYRGITIADQIFEHDVVFAVKEGEELAIEKMVESGYDYVVFENEEKFLEFVSDVEPDVVVNDLLNTSPEYVLNLKEMGLRVVNFEDLGDGTKHADAVINALYEYTDPPPNHYYGHRYFCLRNEFRYAEPHSLIPSVDRIMVSFGGADRNNLTAKVLTALTDLDRALTLDVVLGLGYSKHETLDPIIERFHNGVSVQVNQNVKSMAERMGQADLLITSNGRTLFESTSMNLPVISIEQNHREGRHTFAHVSRGVISLGLGKHVSDERIRTAVEDYIQHHKRREAMREALAEHDVKNGLNRVKDIIFSDTAGY